jgi:GxxExxY protein
MTENDIASEIVDSALQVHRSLGPGLLESVYEAVLSYELRKRGLECRHQIWLPVIYETVHLEMGFRPDIIVNELVIIEIKSVETLHPVHKKQLLTYLRLANKRLGLLVNFNTALIKEGLHRVVNGMPNT